MCWQVLHQYWLLCYDANRVHSLVHCGSFVSPFPAHIRLWPNEGLGPSSIGLSPGKLLLGSHFTNICTDKVLKWNEWWLKWMNPWIMIQQHACHISNHPSSVHFSAMFYACQQSYWIKKSSQATLFGVAVLIDLIYYLKGMWVTQASFRGSTLVLLSQFLVSERLMRLCSNVLMPS